jgi:cell division septation protein DedD
MAKNSRNHNDDMEETSLPSGNIKKILYWIVPIAVIVIVVIIFGGNIFKNEDARYNELIKKADIAFNAGKYEEAKEHYMEASEIKPAEKYPGERLSEIEGMVQEKGKTEMYDKAIAEAESLMVVAASSEGNMAREKYQEVMRYYIKASKIKPDQEYPKEKITQIKNYLSGETEQKPEAGGEITGEQMGVTKKTEETKVTTEAVHTQKQAPREATPSATETSGMKEGKKRFHIIVGAFQNENNAYRYSQRLKAKGFDSIIIPIKDGEFKAVTCGSFTTREEASEALTEVQKQVKQDAWILKR